MFDYNEYNFYDQYKEYKPCEKEIAFQKTEIAMSMKKMIDGYLQMPLDGKIKLHEEYRKERKRLGLYVPQWAPANSVKISYEAPRIVAPKNINRF